MQQHTGGGACWGMLHVGAVCEGAGLVCHLHDGTGWGILHTGAVWRGGGLGQHLHISVQQHTGYAESLGK